MRMLDLMGWRLLACKSERDKNLYGVTLLCTIFLSFILHALQAKDHAFPYVNTEF